jgi:hypothetical protein
MDTDALYATFTHPKVVTSMLLIGIGLGLALSVLMRFFWGQWYLPVGMAAVGLGTMLVYMVWLDRQEFQNGQETGLLDEQESSGIPKTRIVLPARQPVIPDPSARNAIFTNPRVITSMIFLGIGLGIALCALIILFRRTWYLPALVAALTMGSAVGYLYWLDGQDFRDDEEQGF